MRSITVVFLPATLTLILLGGSLSASLLEEATATIEVETQLVQVDVSMYFEPANFEEIVMLSIGRFPITLTEEQCQVAQQTGSIVQKNLDTDDCSLRLRIVRQDLTTGAAGTLWVQVGGE